MHKYIKAAESYSEEKYPGRFTYFEVVGASNGTIGLMGNTTKQYLEEHCKENERPLCITIVVDKETLKVVSCEVEK